MNEIKLLQGGLSVGQHQDSSTTEVTLDCSIF